MATFAVTVERLHTIEPHPNADRLDLAVVGDYRSIIMKGQYGEGDLVAYIPEASIMPTDLIEEMGLTGRLAGSQNNRVKAIRLRGIVSQGLCYPAREGWTEGQVVTDELGIIKYVPSIPTCMGGQVFAAGHERCIRFDVENIKRYPDVIQDGEEVVMTEKLHGTWCQVGVLPDKLGHEKHGTLIVSSKGMAGKGLAFQTKEGENKNNLYLRANRGHKVEAAIRSYYIGALGLGLPVFVLGEVFGHGVQDLHYGATTATDERLGFRVFDIYVGIPGQGNYLNDVELEAACTAMGLDRVPVLYRGPFSKEILMEWTTGNESVSGKEMHMREGVVVKPVIERRDDTLSGLGRVMVKSVSDKYLLRKSKNATEFD